MQNPLDEKLPAYVLVPIPLEMLENSGIDIGDMVQFASGEGIVVMEAVEGPEIINFEEHRDGRSCCVDSEESEGE